MQTLACSRSQGEARRAAAVKGERSEWQSHAERSGAPLTAAVARLARFGEREQAGRGGNGPGCGSRRARAFGLQVFSNAVPSLLSLTVTGTADLYPAVKGPDVVCRGSSRPLRAGRPGSSARAAPGLRRSFGPEIRGGSTVQCLGSESRRRRGWGLGGRAPAPAGVQGGAVSPLAFLIAARLANCQGRAGAAWKECSPPHGRAG